MVPARTCTHVRAHGRARRTGRLPGGYRPGFGLIPGNHTIQSEVVDLQGFQLRKGYFSCQHPRKCPAFVQKFVTPKYHLRVGKLCLISHDVPRKPASLSQNRNIPLLGDLQNFVTRPSVPSSDPATSGSGYRLAMRGAERPHRRYRTR